MADDVLSKLAIKEVKTQSDYLAENIKKMIVNQEFDENYSFPNENEFCKILNVSRATLREAYKILDTQGYIRRTKHGTYIRRREEIAKDGNFVASMEMADKTEVWEFICALEPEAAFLAAQKATEDDLSELKQLMKECEEAAEDNQKLVKTNGRFHAKIRSMAKNILLTSAMQAYYEIFTKQIVETIYAGNKNLSAFREKSLKQHRKLVKAIESGDSDGARQIAWQHLRDDIEFHQLQE